MCLEMMKRIKFKSEAMYWSLHNQKIIIFIKKELNTHFLSYITHCSNKKKLAQKLTNI